MTMAVLSWVLAIPLLGVMTGLRTMTPIAVMCWFAYLGQAGSQDQGDLPVAGTWAFWTAKLATVVIFTLFALGEYVGDKLPKTPNRIAPGPLGARIIFGGLVGAIAATAMEGSVIEGVILGSLGALVGAFVGYHVRKHVVEQSGRPDWNVALLEDVSALLLSILALGIITG
ncbi:putative membrane protein [Granulicella aggregans]|jgi:uncharacterized membrane protein|uniref:Putative membrane protein n=1 Tax=Granulicella aggregans TaxID=474949 RepID=A0A7W7ZC79_9BACT|nr:DUF4126 family protein [Granulicella aggregans]MBB5057216.1 putative membrane protein [Granulicella aggregans]